MVRGFFTATTKIEGRAYKYFPQAVTRSNTPLPSKGHFFTQYTLPLNYRYILPLITDKLCRLPVAPASRRFFVVVTTVLVGLAPLLGQALNCFLARGATSLPRLCWCTAATATVTPTSFLFSLRKQDVRRRRQLAEDVPVRIIRK